MGKAWRTTQTIPSRLEDAADFEQQLLEKVAALGFNENSCFAIRLALDEALSNAIHHGNCNDPEKKITVEAVIDDEAFHISVCDEGCGFCPEALPDPTAEPNLERPCGRGVMLIRAYMTKVHYNDKGNCLHMVKRRDCTLPHLPGSSK